MKKITFIKIALAVLAVVDLAFACYGAVRNDWGAALTSLAAFVGCVTGAIFIREDAGDLEE